MKIFNWISESPERWFLTCLCIGAVITGIAAVAIYLGIKMLLANPPSWPAEINITIVKK